MSVRKIMQVTINCLPSETKFPPFCYHCGQPTKNLIKYNYPVYHKVPVKKKSEAFQSALFLWGAVAFLFTIALLGVGYDFFTVIAANFVVLCVFMAIAMFVYDCERNSEKFLQPQEYIGLSMPVCPACADSTISRKKLVRTAFGGFALIMLPFIIFLVGDFKFITISAASISFISGVILFIRAFNYSKGLRSLTIWKDENRYLWLIRNQKFAQEFALLSSVKDKNTV